MNSIMLLDILFSLEDNPAEGISQGQVLGQTALFPQIRSALPTFVWEYTFSNLPLSTHLSSLWHFVFLAMVHIQSDLSGILQAQHPLIFHVSVCLYFVSIAQFTFTEQSYSLFQIL